jgi:hypothetical protein
MADSYVDPTAMSPLPGSPNFQWNAAQYALANPNAWTSQTTQSPTGTVSTIQNPNVSYGTGSNTSPTGPAPVTQQQSSGGTTASSEPDLNSQLDAIFNPQLASLSGQEASVNQQYGNTVTGIGDQAAVSSASLNQANTQGMREMAGQEKGAGVRKEDALTSATRLYNELQRGGQQRFGGASSAGEAYQTLTATEQQRRQGTIQTAYETAMQQVGALKANLAEKFTLATKELEIQKNSALADAKASFDEGIRQIQAQRNQLGSDRATASLNILQDLRNKVYQINMQALQFTQQLALNNQTSNQKVEQATQNFIKLTSAGQSGVEQFGTQAMNAAGQTNLGMSPTQNSTQSPYQAGQMQSRMGYHWDETKGQMVPD